MACTAHLLEGICGVALGWKNKPSSSWLYPSNLSLFIVSEVPEVTCPPLLLFYIHSNENQFNKPFYCDLWRGLTYFLSFLSARPCSDISVGDCHDGLRTKSGTGPLSFWAHIEKKCNSVFIQSHKFKTWSLFKKNNFFTFLNIWDSYYTEFNLQKCKNVLKCFAH